ncbi:hypothetical protein [Luteimonas mephitis]|uniref:hypothetical protein n=1 Tax=Luteimonas mephitis TaxID=83615 RepID=UPI003A927D50
MVEIRELEAGVEVIATSYREKFNSRFKAIMAAHALAYGESELHGGSQVAIVVPPGWGEGYAVRQRADQSVASGADNRG